MTHRLKKLLLCSLSKLRHCNGLVRSAQKYKCQRKNDRNSKCTTSNLGFLTSLFEKIFLGEQFFFDVYRQIINFACSRRLAETVFMYAARRDRWRKLRNSNLWPGPVLRSHFCTYMSARLTFWQKIDVMIKMII